MISNNKTLNEKPAAATIRSRLDFVFSTIHPTRKDRINVFYHAAHARV